MNQRGGADKTGHEGPTGPWYQQGVHTISMVMVSTLVCLLSEVRLSPPKLTKADIVGVALSQYISQMTWLPPDGAGDELQPDEKLCHIRLFIFSLSHLCLICGAHESF